MYWGYHHNNTLVQGLQYLNDHSASMQYICISISPLLITIAFLQSTFKLRTCIWDICMTLFQLRKFIPRYISPVLKKYVYASSNSSELCIYSVQITAVCNLHLTIIIEKHNRKFAKCDYNLRRKQAHGQSVTSSFPIASSCDAVWSTMWLSYEYTHQHMWVNNWTNCTPTQLVSILSTLYFLIGQHHQVHKSIGRTTCIKLFYSIQASALFPDI